MSPGAHALVALSLVLSACGGGGGGSPPVPDAGLPTGDAATSGAPRVELGTGRTSFEEIPETGAQLELVAGPQGGWHVWTTARIYGMPIDGLLLTYEIRRDGVIISMPRQFELHEALVIREADHWLRLGDFVPFDVTQPSDVVGDTVVVRAIADATDGAHAEDERTVRIVDLE